MDLTTAERFAVEDLASSSSCPGEDLDVLLRRIPAPALVVIGSAATSQATLAKIVRRRAETATVLVICTPNTEHRLRSEVSSLDGMPFDISVLGMETLRQQATIVLARNAARQPPATRTFDLAALSSPHTLLGTSVIDFAPLLDRAPVGVLVCDLDGLLRGWNQKASNFLDLGRMPTSMHLADVLPEAVGLLDAFDDGDPEVESLEVGLVAATATGQHLEVTAVRTDAEQGYAEVLLLLVDVTESRRSERDRERLSRQVDLLARISEALISTLEIEEALDRLADVLVPEFADWVSIQLADELGALSQVTVRHCDPQLTETVNAMQARQQLFASEEAPSRRVARGEGPMLLPVVDEEELFRSVEDPELRALVTQLGLGSVVAVPLPGRDGLQGSLVLVRDRDRGAFRQSHLSVAVEAGRRAGLALDNARLYTRQHDLAGELQRSLLTDPPEVVHGQIAVRYVAAAHEAQVGGDWYDAFVQPDGATVLVVGDVVGHDRRAAAGMSQIRGVLRGIGYTTGDDPAMLLTHVDRAMEGLAIQSMATAVVARFEPITGRDEAGQALRPELLRVSWSCAGHPPPVLLTPEGEVRVLGEVGAPGAAAAQGGGGSAGPEPDLLLGLDPETPRAVATAEVPDGSTLFLYSDGLVERRDEDLDEGIFRLADALALGPENEPLEALCDRVLEQLLPVEPEDDVALVAIRLGIPPRRLGSPPQF